MELKERLFKYRYAAVFAVTLVVMCVFFALNLQQFPQKSESLLSTPFIIAFAVSIILVCALFVILRRCKKVKIEAIAVTVFAVLAIGYNFVFTPMTVPDEPNHYASAYNISNCMMFNFSGGVPMRADDCELYYKSSPTAAASNYKTVNDKFSLTVKNDTLKETNTYIIKDRPLAYISPAVGLTIGRLLHLGAYPTFYLGRLFNLLFIALCLYFAMKLMPFSKTALFAIATFPMTLHLACSYSYDCYNIGLCMVLFSYLVRLIYSKNKITVRDFITVSLIAFCVLPYKTAYIGLGFLAFFIPKENFKTKRQNYLYKLVFAFIGIVGIIPVQIGRIFSLSAETTVVNGEAVHWYSLADIITSPVNSILVVCRTVARNFKVYYLTMVADQFGWLQLHLSVVFTLLFTLILIYSLTKVKGSADAIRPRGRIFVGVIMLATYLLVIVLLMMDFTPKGADAVIGVQGRYFLPALPLIVLLLRNNKLSIKNDPDRNVVFASAYLNIFAVSSLFLTVAAL